MPNPNTPSTEAPAIPGAPTAARRGFLRLATAAAAAGLFTRTLSGQAAPGRGSQAGPNEDWLKGLGTRHRQFFDCGVIGAHPLARVQSFLDCYNESYGVPDAEIGAIVGCHGDGIGFVLGDEAWRRFELGARYSVIDPASGKPAIRNPFRDSPGQASINDLRKRGVRFIGCNNTLRRLSRQLAGPSGSADEVHSALVGSVVTGIQIVPAMIVAGNRAQESLFSYVSMR
jgi:hypothetical protein